MQRHLLGSSKDQILRPSTVLPTHFNSSRRTNRYKRNYAFLYPILLCFIVSILLFISYLSYLSLTPSLPSSSTSSSFESSSSASASTSSSKSSEYYDKQRQARVDKRLEYLTQKQNKGLSLAPSESFDLHFLSFTKTKSRVSGQLGDDHCHFSGPKQPIRWTLQREEKFLEKLIGEIDEGERLSDHLEESNAVLLSPEHKLCTDTHRKENVLHCAFDIFNVCFVFVASIVEQSVLP